MIYLRKEDGSYVGPFRSCKDAERFIQLMQLCREIWAGTEIVDDECNALLILWYGGRITLSDMESPRIPIRGRRSIFTRQSAILQQPHQRYDIIDRRVGWGHRMPSEE